MSFEYLLETYASSSKVLEISNHIEAKSNPKLFLRGVLRGLDSFIIQSVYTQKKGLHLVVVNDKEDAAYLQNDLSMLLDKKDVYFFPDSFKKPADFNNISKNNVLLRTETLNQIANTTHKGELIVTYPEALLEKVIHHEEFIKKALFVKTEQFINIDQIIETLNNLSFERADFVYEPGQFSIRGDIIDIFSFANDYPYRIELFGNEVESIRTFDPMTQLSVKKIKQIVIIPNLSRLAEDAKMVSLLDFLPAQTIIWMEDVQFSLEKFQLALEKALPVHEEKVKENKDEFHLLKRELESIFEQPKPFFEKLLDKTVIQLGKRTIFQEVVEIPFEATPQPSINKNFNVLAGKLEDLHKNKFTNFIFADSTKQIYRLQNIFEDKQQQVEYIPIKKSLSRGFIDKTNQIACFTEHQIFDKYNKFQIKKSFSKDQSLLIKTIQELKPGDYVTHIDHGIGKYSGLEKIEVNGQVQEAVRLVYGNNDLLYVSVNSLHKIAKYVGKDGTPPKLNKIGSDAWSQLKQKTKKKVKDIGRDLIKLYAKRKASKGFSFSPDTYLQHELEASFTYEDTPDQLKATQAVKADMEEESPMDRLVCGDVGFGKTEIAIRAAYKAVADSKQVAVLVPTTILALQHHKSFQKRIGDLPCNIDYLNRFKTQKQKSETLQKLAEGKTDIIIGTHALIGKKVKFKNLGLLIIDEEQKFGVTVKEKLKAIKANIDCLTLTATPIPRTLQFSLMGSRDLSIMNTPPPNRQPINTELHTWNGDLIKNAIYFEINRGGQVFFVHNRVKNIKDIYGMLKKLCPNLDIGIAHGQMDGDELEEILNDFLERKYDILLSTSIIESGIDISNVNTIIINNANAFGLSDIHQLRGRVGRSNQKAFCYLLAPPLSTLTPEARKRLQTIVDFSDLGSGFNIAMRDLDIRGAGNILGAEQSGFVAEIGFNMYQKILNEAISELKETEFKDLFAKELSEKEVFVRDCQIETDMELHIPDLYIRNVQERLTVYTDLNNVKNEEELILFHEMLSDRFGKIPRQVLELSDTIRLQWIAKKLGFERIVIKKSTLKCFFIENQKSSFYDSDIFGRLIQYIQSNPQLGQLKQTSKYLILTIPNIPSIKEAHYTLQSIQRGIKLAVTN